MISVFLLGHRGMLGNAVHKYLSKCNLEIITTSQKWPNKAFKNEILSFEGDFLINCIGVIPQKKDLSFDINFELPIWLDQNVECKIIHPGTDCEMDLDKYGVSKFKAAEYIKQFGSNTKIIKTSIIGHELMTCYSLLDWFLNSEKLVQGYINVFWNGNTTLEWAKFCLKLIKSWDKYTDETILMTECISKYKLLQIISKVYEKNIVIEKDNKHKLNKCLKGSIKNKSIESQLIDLKKFYS